MRGGNPGASNHADIRQHKCRIKVTLDDEGKKYGYCNGLSRSWNIFSSFTTSKRMNESMVLGSVPGFHIPKSFLLSSRKM